MPGLINNFLLNGAHGQIDNILINNKWKSSALNCQAHHSFATVKSDHRILTARFWLSLRANKPEKSTNLFNWSALDQTGPYRPEELPVGSKEQVWGPVKGSACGVITQAHD